MISPLAPGRISLRSPAATSTSGLGALYLYTGKSHISSHFSGVAVDAQKSGTIMVAALNSWWPDGQIFRSTDSGTTWTSLWSWQSYPTMNRFYAYDDSLAPWIGPDSTAGDIEMQIGWMMEGLVIDPFDSNHWLYGTGETVYGGHDLLKWDSGASHNVTLKSLADGIEETSVQGLISPPSGPQLISAIGDVDGMFPALIAKINPYRIT